jgi:predicted CoA-binding protein
LVLEQPVFQDVHGRQEVVALNHQVDVVEVFTATKAVRQVVARIVRCLA